MKTLRFLFFLMLVFLMFGCKDGSDGNDGTNGTDSNPGSETVTVSNPSGKIETAFCKKGTVVWATSVDSTWTQTGALSGEVKTNDGSYIIRGDFSGPFISYLVPSGTCYNESYSSYTDNVILRGMEHYTATEHNKNYATSLEYYIGEDHFFDSGSPGYDNIPNAFTLAKSEILDYFNFPSLSKGFNELTVVGDTTADAYLLALEIFITDAGGGSNQYDRLAELGIAILENDLSYRATVRNFVANIEVKRITDNIKNERVNLGFSAEVAPLWNLPIFPDYYADLMGNTINIEGSQGLDYTGYLSIGDTSMNIYATPFVFRSWIETSEYLAMNVNGNPAVSIWTRTFDVYDRPGTKVMDLENLREIILDDPVKLTYNGKLNGVLTAGIDYYIRFDYPLGTSFSWADGDFLPFGKNLCSKDGGVTWYGHDSNIPSAVKTGLKIYGVSTP